MKLATLLLLAASYVQADNIALLPTDGAADDAVIEIDLDKIEHEHGEFVLDDEDDWAHTLMLPSGSTVRFRMHENPTTGYSWQVIENTCADKWMTDVDSQYEAPNTRLMGAGGYHLWTFQTPSDRT